VDLSPIESLLDGWSDWRVEVAPELEGRAMTTRLMSFGQAILLLVAGCVMTAKFHATTASTLAGRRPVGSAPRPRSARSSTAGWR
jgi:hypothetical protein